ncbi:peptidase M28, putative [Acanthamoeba castellanii str. Neff]|uniref:Carboxypeptidase Q n=1 Tax=Acanthamoeba castellanii (strain ATCC 30010 / Neff) TaxID=1257118 RepID=L8H4G1_ACACF|nr:peptidase M28, putative [Acanthamoeba castellanii str. Neff]ELR20065.1 peptidase M28, putative [Acanthamoeba castellanii str. Neff]
MAVMAAASAAPAAAPYEREAAELTKAALTGTDFSKLEYLCDTFGPRFSGSENQVLAIDWMLEKDGLANVRGEPVDGIINWKRGKESLELLHPRRTSMALLGLGKSAGTGSEGVTAEVFVVSTFEELTANADKAKGKIVLFNAPFTTYGQTVAFRSRGADAASAVGAVAALVRSVTPYSLYTPHTGGVNYSDKQPRIPAAAVTVEDSEMMARMQKRGQAVVVRLQMDAQILGYNVSSRNVIAEVVGGADPEGIVLLGGHVDSWDVGTGAVDDGAGFFCAWEAVRLINDLIEERKIARPRRTIRFIAWADEEMTGRGAVTYKETHEHELKRHQIAVESDIGNFDPYGFGFTGSADGLAIFRNLSGLLEPVKVGEIVEGAGTTVDNAPLVAAGVPGGALLDSKGSSHYFNYHHSSADTITALNYDGVRRSVAAMAVMSYVLADIPDDLPHAA